MKLVGGWEELQNKWKQEHRASLKVSCNINGKGPLAIGPSGMALAGQHTGLGTHWAMGVPVFFVTTETKGIIFKHLSCRRNAPLFLATLTLGRQTGRSLWLTDQPTQPTW